MAKSTFVIRASVNGGNAGSFTQTEIDLGSYTNLGSSKPEVLRIHRSIVMFTNGAGAIPTMTGDKGDSAGWQLTTQSQSAMIQMTDDSYVAGGIAGFRNPDSETINPTQVYSEQILAQDYEAGYLVAVPSLFLGCLVGGNFATDGHFEVILECSTEAMSKSNAVSLAVSQQ
tara:strand:- start:756 stop:1268 length:513 start_codon:yes stop_codon:yes gene_type:complete